ncbi:MAG: WG repeat-containing protein [Ferruginibacter sp.]
MRFFSIGSLILLLVTNFSVAQVIRPLHVESEDKNRDYYFKTVASNGSYDYPNVASLQRKDILDMFISDSNTFHIRNKTVHQQNPHICQNKFHKFGLLSKENNIQIPFEFDYIIHSVDTMVFIAMKNNKYGLINNKSKTVLPFIFEYCNPIYDMLAMKKKNADSTLIFYSIRGQYLFSAQGYSADEKEVGYISIDNKKDQKGVINKKGKWILAAGSDYIAWIKDDYICCYRNERYGIITVTGKPVIPFEYLYIRPTDNDQFRVYRKDIAAVVDTTNHFIIPFDSMTIENFGAFYLFHKRNLSGSGMFNFKGEQILSPDYSIYSPQVKSGFGKFIKVNSDALLFATNDRTRLVGVYKSDGVQLLPANNLNSYWQKDGNIILYTKRSETDSMKLLSGAIDLDGKPIIAISTDKLFPLHCNLDMILAIDSAKKNTLINIITGERISFNGYQLGNFDIQLQDGYIIAVKEKSYKCALVSPQGKKLTEAIYDSLGPVTEKDKKLFDKEVVCIAKTKDGLVGITKTGKEIVAKKM